MNRHRKKPSRKISDLTLFALICEIVTAIANAPRSVILIILLLYGIIKLSGMSGLVAFLFRKVQAIPFATVQTPGKTATTVLLAAKRFYGTSSQKIRSLVLKNPHGPDGFSAIQSRIYAWCMAAVGFTVTLCFFPGGYKEIRIPLMLMCIIVCSVIFASVCKKEKRLGAILMNALLMLGFFTSFMSANMLSIAGTSDIVALGTSGCLLFVWVHKVPIADYLPRR